MTDLYDAQDYLPHQTRADDLIRRGDALEGPPQCGQCGWHDTIAALPAVAPGVRVKPTAAQIADACMWYRHDFGLLSDEERKPVIANARYWLEAWQKALPTALDTPAPALMDELVEAIAAEARRYAAFYPIGSDGQNTFVMFAEWVESRAALAKIGWAV